MCGIAGICLDKGIKHYHVSTGLALAELQGGDGVGIAARQWPRGTVATVKSGKVLHQVWRRLDKTLEGFGAYSWKPAMVLLHARRASRGAVNAENAHPHRAGPVRLVHNGHIRNAPDLGVGQGRCDSLAAAKALAAGSPTLDGYRESLARLEGWMALGWFDDRNDGLWFYTDRVNLLYWAETRDGLVFATREDWVDVLVAALDLAREYTVYPVDGIAHVAKHGARWEVVEWGRVDPNLPSTTHDRMGYPLTGQFDGTVFPKTDWSKP